MMSYAYAYSPAAPAYYGNQPYYTDTTSFAGQYQSFGVPSVAAAAPSAAPDPIQNADPKAYATLTLKDHLRNVKKVEDSFFDAYHKLELEHYNINQVKSDDYTKLHFAANEDVTKFRLKFEAVKTRLSDKDAKDAEDQGIFFKSAGDSGPGVASVKPQPLEELKALRARIRHLRSFLQSKVKDEKKSNKE